MKYNMRSLKTSDVFKMSKILKQMALKVEVPEDASQIQAGIEIIKTALENLHLAEAEVSEFLGSMVGITGEEFNNLPIEESLEVITLFKEQKGIINFLKQAGKLMK